MEPWGRPGCKGYKFLIFSLFHERKSINISAGLPAGWLGEHPQSWETQRGKSALEQMAAEEHASVTFCTSVDFALQKPLAFPYNVTTLESGLQHICPGLCQRDSSGLQIPLTRAPRGCSETPASPEHSSASHMGMSSARDDALALIKVSALWNNWSH